QKDFLIPIMQGINYTEEPSIQSIYQTWHGIRGHEFAKSGIESALYSLIAEQKKVSLGDLYGSSKDKIPTGVSIGIQNDLESLLNRIDFFIKQGYQRIKMKIEPGWDYEVVSAVRKEFGDILLMVDANSAYSLNDKHVETLKKLDKFELMMIEQPLAYNDILAHKQLQAQLDTPVCLDESIHDPMGAQLALENDCCRIINIKPGRVGGYTNAIEIAKYGGAGRVWCGGMLETGIGRIHNLFLQARSEFTMPGDTSGSNRYFEKDIISPEVIVNDLGYITIPKGVGLGVTVLDDYLQDLKVRSKLYHFN
ncbi:MAG: o-succinylbenzoate synthase, partial [Candidatus Heimdallarchaeota archaeon]|nr:o-succinylbenzoate synthase [Candidatus Heimdallarchaeota archaeon]